MSKFESLYNDVINEAGVIDKLRSMNYNRLSKRSFKKATDALNKTHDYGFADSRRFPHEKEFSKQMSKMSQREKKAKELKK